MAPPPSTTAPPPPATTVPPVAGPVDVSLLWSDDVAFGVTIRTYSGLPSYLPASLDTGGGTVEIGSWGDNPRTMVFSRENEYDATLTWEAVSGGLVWSFVSSAPPDEPEDDPDEPEDDPDEDPDEPVDPVLPPGDDTMGVPAAPVNVSAIRFGTSVRVSWEVGADALGFAASWSDSADTASEVDTESLVDEGYVSMTLVDDVTVAVDADMFVNVWAHNRWGWSEPTTVTATNPTFVEDLNLEIDEEDSEEDGSEPEDGSDSESVRLSPAATIGVARFVASSPTAGLFSVVAGPTVAQEGVYVERNELHEFIVYGLGPDDRVATALTQWVEEASNTWKWPKYKSFGTFPDDWGPSDYGTHTSNHKPWDYTWKKHSSKAYTWESTNHSSLGTSKVTIETLNPDCGLPKTCDPTDIVTQTSGIYKCESGTTNGYNIEFFEAHTASYVQYEGQSTPGDLADDVYKFIRPTRMFDPDKYDEMIWTYDTNSNTVGTNDFARCAGMTNTCTGTCNYAFLDKIAYPGRVYVPPRMNPMIADALWTNAIDISGVANGATIYLEHRYEDRQFVVDETNTGAADNYFPTGVRLDANSNEIDYFRIGSEEDLKFGAHYRVVVEADGIPGMSNGDFWLKWLEDSPGPPHSPRFEDHYVWIAPELIVHDIDVGFTQIGWEIKQSENRNTRIYYREQGAPIYEFTDVGMDGYIRVVTGLKPGTNYEYYLWWESEDTYHNHGSRPVTVATLTRLTPEFTPMRHSDFDSLSSDHVAVKIDGLEYGDYVQARVYKDDGTPEEWASEGQSRALWSDGTKTEFRDVGLLQGYSGNLRVERGIKSTDDLGYTFGFHPGSVTNPRIDLRVVRDSTDYYVWSFIPDHADVKSAAALIGDDNRLVVTGIKSSITNVAYKRVATGSTLVISGASISGGRAKIAMPAPAGASQHEYEVYLCENSTCSTSHKLEGTVETRARLSSGTMAVQLPRFSHAANGDKTFEFTFFDPDANIGTEIMVSTDGLSIDEIDLPPDNPGGHPFYCNRGCYKTDRIDVTVNWEPALAGLKQGNHRTDLVSVHELDSSRAGSFRHSLSDGTRPPNETVQASLVRIRKPGHAVEYYVCVGAHRSYWDGGGLSRELSTMKIAGGVCSPTIPTSTITACPYPRIALGGDTNCKM